MEAGYRISELPTGFCVKNQAAERISPVLPSSEAAEDWAVRMLGRDQPAERRCLCCGNTFASEGSHDRLCPHCGCARGMGFSGALNLHDANRRVRP